MKSLIDNDVLVKGSCYDLLQELATAVPGDLQRAGILGASQFVVPKLIAKKQLRNKPAKAQAVFDSFVQENDVVEPTIDEQLLAARLESTAQALAVNMDVGESQLTAILISRAVPFLLTGDKRAITAMERLLDNDKTLAVMAGRIKCLEQLVSRLLEYDDTAKIRGAICAEPAIDKALSICFSCSRPETDRATICEGLNSYISAIRVEAKRVLST